MGAQGDPIAIASQSRAIRSKLLPPCILVGTGRVSRRFAAAAQGSPRMRFACRPRPFQIEQLPLQRSSAGSREPSQRAGRTDDAMTRDHKREAIAGHRVSDGASRAWITGLRRQLAVRKRVTGANPSALVYNAPLEVGQVRQIEWHITKVITLAAGVRLNPLGQLTDERRRSAAGNRCFRECGIGRGCGRMPQRERAKLFPAPNYCRPPHFGRKDVCLLECRCGRR